jgi:hypothetical protein
LSLLYYDERVRKEGFDIEYLMQSILQPPRVDVPPTTPGPEVVSPAG